MEYFSQPYYGKGSIFASKKYQCFTEVIHSGAPLSLKSDGLCRLCGLFNYVFLLATISKFWYTSWNTRCCYSAQCTLVYLRLSKNKPGYTHIVKHNINHQDFGHEISLWKNKQSLSEYNYTNKKNERLYWKQKFWGSNKPLQYYLALQKFLIPFKKMANTTL